jgi:hypothetical protein
MNQKRKIDESGSPVTVTSCYHDITPLLMSKDLGEVITSPERASSACRTTCLFKVDVVDGNFAHESMVAVVMWVIALVLNVPAAIAELTLM